MRPVAIALTLLLPALATAQVAAPQRTLESLMREHRSAIEAASRSADPNEYDAALLRYRTALQEYLKDEAKGEDVHRTRFALVHALLIAGDQPAAENVLKKFDAKTAPCLSCGEAAFLASTLGLQAEYEGWVTIALAKEAKPEDRMELGVMLMSRLRKPEVATKLFADAMAKAKTDDARSRVAWHLARATREREDIPEDAYDRMLEDLAKKYPRTRYGGIARDRLLAMQFRTGQDPIPFEVETLDGKAFALPKHKGKAVLICFWASLDPRSVEAVQTLQDLHRQYAENGLVVLGISLDERKADAADALATWKTSFPNAWVAGSWDSDLALRYRVEDVPHCLLVGRDGKIAGMNFVLNDDSGRKQLIDAVRQATRQSGGDGR